MTIIRTRTGRLSFCTALLALCLLSALPAYAQYGHLFTSAAEREYLDFLRAEYLRNNQVDDFNIAETIPEIPVIEEEVTANTGPEFYRLGGIITQRDGSRTLWLNNVAVNERDLPQNMRLLTAGNTLALRISLEQGTFDLRPGQTLDVFNARVRDGFDAIDSSVESNPADNNIASSDINPPAETGSTINNTINREAGLSLNDASAEELQELMNILQAMQAEQANNNAP